MFSFFKVKILTSLLKVRGILKPVENLACRSEFLLQLFAWIFFNIFFVSRHILHPKLLLLFNCKPPTTVSWFCVNNGNNGVGTTFTRLSSRGRRRKKSILYNLRATTKIKCWGRMNREKEWMRRIMMVCVGGGGYLFDAHDRQVINLQLYLANNLSNVSYHENPKK